MALYLFGASVTKDFSDVAGDKADGCLTFPVMYGVRQTIRIISPFFILPWILLSISAPKLSGNIVILECAAVLLLGCSIICLQSLHSSVTVSSTHGKGTKISRRPSSLDENNNSWRYMYATVMIYHLSTCAAYYFV